MGKMKAYQFIVEGQPKGKGRPRFTTSGGYPRTYTPLETRRYEERIRECFFEQVKEPIEKDKIDTLQIIAFYQVPASESKKRKQLMIDGKLSPTVKPDLDNVIKVVLDALNGIAYNDDKQLLNIYASKFYGAKPMLMVQLSEIEEEKTE